MLLLSEDALQFVQRLLPRRCLDELTTVNSVIHRGIARASEPSSTGPRRPLTVNVLQPCESYVNVIVRIADPTRPEPTLHNWRPATMRCCRPEQLRLALKDSFVLNIAFYDASPAMHTLLCELAPLWRDGNVFGHPSTFESLDHFTRFFTDLARTTARLDVDLKHQVEFELKAQHFWAQVAVRRCAWLRIENMPRGAIVYAEDLIEWLMLPHETAVRKRVDINESALAVHVEEFVIAIKSDFETAVERCGFTIGIFWRPPYRNWFNVNDPGDAMINAGTGEELRLKYGESVVTIDRIMRCH